MFSVQRARKSLVWLDVQSELQHKFLKMRLKSYIYNYCLLETFGETNSVTEMVCFAWKEMVINVWLIAVTI